MGVALEDILKVVNHVYFSKPPEVEEVEPKYSSFPFPKARKGQNEAIEALLKYNRVVLCSPTGSGKTAVYLTALAEFGGRSLIIQPRVDLQKQIVECYGRYFPIKLLMARYRYPCATEFGYACRFRYKRRGRWFFRYNKEEYLFPCTDCIYDNERATILDGYKSGTVIPIANQGNFLLFLTVATPSFVVVDEADEFCRSICQFITVRERYYEYIKGIFPEVYDCIVKFLKGGNEAYFEGDVRELLEAVQYVIDREIKIIEEVLDAEKNPEITREPDKIAKLNEELERLDKERTYISKIFIPKVDRCFVYKERKSNTIHVELFMDEEEVVNHFFGEIEKVAIVSATPSKVWSNYKYVYYDIPFKSRVIYAPVEKLTYTNIFRRRNVDKLEKVVTNYIIPIHDYIAKLTGRSKTPIHCGNISSHGRVVWKTLNSNGRNTLLHEKGRLDKVIEEFIKGDYELLCVCAAEYGGDWPFAPLQFILKVPFADPTDPREVAIRHRFGEDVWRKRYELDAMSRLIQACGRNARSPEDFAITIILDSKFEELYDKYIGSAPQWFKSRLIQLKEGSGSTDELFRCGVVPETGTVSQNI
jgi:Rad3-related DNA helicase